MNGIKKENGKLLFRVFNKNKEGVLIASPSNPDEKVRYSWEEFNKHFVHVKDHWYKLNDQNDEIQKISKIGKWISDRPFLMALLYSKNPNWQSMAMLGSSCSEFCKEFNETPESFVNYLQDYSSVLKNNLGKF